MNLNRLQNVLLFLLVMVLAVSLAFCSSLSLMEYLRIFILGSAVALLFATFPRTFGASYTRKCVLGFSYAFILYALDPNTNSVIKFGATQNISNIYRLVTAILLLAALITWLIPVATRTIGVKKWCKQFSRTELYLLAALVSFGLIGMVLEVLFIHESAASFYNSLLRGTKIIDCSVVFLLITHAFNSSSHSTPGSWRYTILVIALLAFSAFISLIGGARAYSAYSSARKWKTKSGTVPGRERLLRVFSLNSEEAASLYEAGYAAGIKKWDKVHARLKRADKFKRDFVVEAEALAFIAENRYTAAISTLETLPIEYTIKSDISPGLNAITTQIKAGTEISSLPYLAGLLTLHTDRSKESRIFLDEFLISEPNHANATYFRSYNDSSVNHYLPFLQMPATGWLSPQSLIKSIKEQPGLITIMYNQHIQGTLWLEPGTYAVEVFARDDGTALPTAQETGFDPSCKMRVWIGSQLSQFTVLSTNRQFKSYEMIATIRDVPTEVMIEFTNDIYNQTRGWDRNLSVSRLEFRRRK